MQEKLTSLYCYKLDERKSEFQCYRIPESEITVSYHSWNRARDLFTFRADLGTGSEYRYDIQRRKLDQLLSSKFYTFNPNRSYAIAQILAAIDAKRIKAEREAKRYKRLHTLVEMSSNKEEK